MPIKNGGKGRRDKPFLFGFGSFSGGRTVKLREGKSWLFLYLLKPLQSVVCKNKSCAKNYHLLTLSHETKTYFPFHVLEIILTSRGTKWESTTYRTWHLTAAMIPECLETLYLQHLTGLSGWRNQRGFSQRFFAMSQFLKHLLGKMIYENNKVGPEQILTNGVKGPQYME